MHFWVLDIHPITVPIANELSFAVFQVIKALKGVYSSVLLPTVEDVVLILEVLD